MNLTISFAEISRFVGDHYRKKIAIKQLSTSEFSITYYQKVLIKEVGIDISIKIEEVGCESVIISYSGNIAVEMIIKGALSFLMEKIGNTIGALMIGTDKRIEIDLEKIKKAKAFTDNVALRAISVTSSGLDIEAVLK